MPVPWEHRGRRLELKQCQNSCWKVGWAWWKHPQTLHRPQQLESCLPPRLWQWVIISSRKNVQMRREQVVWERGETKSPLTHTGKAEMLDSLQAEEHSGWAPPASWGFCAVVMNGLWVLTGKRGLLRKLRPTFWLRSHMEEGSAECVHQSLPKLTTSTTLKWIILRTSKIFFFWWGGEAQLAAYVPPSGIKPGSMQQLKAWHLNQQTASEFPKILLKALDVIN